MKKKEVPKCKSNHTGIPTQLKEKYENFSGFSFDDVKVYYNSDRPAQLGAFAYTQGNQVHIGPNQQRHLEHELGHMVQQKAGMVQATATVRGLQINDDPVLEKAADSYFSN